MKKAALLKSLARPKVESMARMTFNELPARTRADLARLDFGEAEKSCPRNLPIGRLMREALELLT